MASAIRSLEKSLAARMCLCAWTTLFAAAAMADTDIAGTRPEYSSRVLSQPPNAAAMRARMWVPEIDLGFVPQGVTVAGDSVLLAAYNGAGGQPRCRLFRIHRRTLAVTGRFDMPAVCGHAGGLAYAGGNRLFVADTGHLFEIDLDRAFDAAHAGDAVMRSLPLRFPLRGSFLAYREEALWIGEYKTPQPGRIVRIPLKVIDAAPQPPGLGEEHANASLEVAPKSQGATFDQDGVPLAQPEQQSGGCLAEGRSEDRRGAGKLCGGCRDRRPRVRCRRPAVGRFRSGIETLAQLADLLSNPVFDRHPGAALRRATQEAMKSCQERAD